MNGSPVELRKIGLKTYTAILTTNGVLEVKLTAFNKMKAALYEQVDVLDDAPPTVKDNVFEDGVLTFRLEDSQSGVDFSSISGCDEDHPEILPLSIDRSTGLVSFALKKENLTIKAKDKIGNELHVTFTPQGESIDEDAQPPAEDADTES